eukprot:CAMPEP_0205801386 /NCGR_PEP_ID=MMETSP0205-20121125/3358_1 /ASSEMBLY_ACC=CAM_ASM_000278 /TAXON_ID=36767 /ORGANISM="Euplotes focardii, Strain TN1" /LENGTH=242 /DNA_ID=CAMNT_0053066049 /DNA_START=20 /DNA_END=744 /DNA_ORIENTATION=-
MNDQASNNSQIGTLPRKFGQPSEGSQIGNLPRRVGPSSTNESQIGNISRREAPSVIGNNSIDKIPMMGSTDRDPIDNIPTLNNDSQDQVNSIPTIGDRNINDSRRRPTDTNNGMGGYMPSGITETKPQESTGGRKRAVDPFAKYDGYEPSKNTINNKPKPTGFGNNISGISHNSGGDSLFNSNKNNDKGFMSKVRQSNEKKEAPKQNDFWGGILDNDKSKKDIPKAQPPKPVSKPVMNNNPG